MLKDILIQDYPTIFKDSVVMLNGDPHYVIGFNGKFAECLNIETQDIDTFDFSKFTSIKIPNTGYFNYRGVCCYISRYPCRKYKHGVSKENIRVLIHMAPDMLADIKTRDCKAEALSLKVKSLSGMYRNKYPTLKEAIKLFKTPGTYSVAFDRQFAIHSTGVISYKTKKVGIYRNNKICLDNAYKHLQIALPKEYQ